MNGGGATRDRVAAPHHLALTDPLTDPLASSAPCAGVWDAVCLLALSAIYSAIYSKKQLGYKVLKAHALQPPPGAAVALGREAATLFWELLADYAVTAGERALGGLGGAALVRHGTGRARYILAFGPRRRESAAAS